MPELTNVRSSGVNGALVFTDTIGQKYFVIGATTGLPFGAYNQSYVTITAATTLVPSTHAGLIVNCTTDAIVVTLPAIATSTNGIQYTIINTASDGGALLELKTGAASDWVIIGGTATATTNLVLANTKTTQKYGDMITVTQGTNTLTTTTTNAWITINKVGTWVAQAAT